MKIIKFTTMSCFLAFVIVYGAKSVFTLAGGLIDMGYGSRGESMGVGSARSKEPIQPIPSVLITTGQR